MVYRRAWRRYRVEHHTWQGEIEAMEIEMFSARDGSQLIINSTKSLMIRAWSYGAADNS